MNGPAPYARFLQKNWHAARRSYRQLVGTNQRLGTGWNHSWHSTTLDCLVSRAAAPIRSCDLHEPYGRLKSVVFLAVVVNAMAVLVYGGFAAVALSGLAGLIFFSLLLGFPRWSRCST